MSWDSYFNFIAAEAERDKMYNAAQILRLRIKLVKDSRKKIPEYTHIGDLNDFINEGNLDKIRIALTSMSTNQLADINVFRELLTDSIKRQPDVLIWALLAGFNYGFIEKEIDINAILEIENKKVLDKIGIIIKAAKMRDICINFNLTFIPKLYNYSKETAKALAMSLSYNEIEKIMIKTESKNMSSCYYDMLINSQPDHYNKIYQQVEKYVYYNLHDNALSDWVYSKMSTQQLIMYNNPSYIIEKHIKYRYKMRPYIIMWRRHSLKHRVLTMRTISA